MENLDSLIQYLTKLGKSSYFISGAKYVINEIKTKYNYYGLELIKSQKEMEQDYYNVLEDHNKWLQSVIKPVLSISFTIKGKYDDEVNPNDKLIIDRRTNEIKIKENQKFEQNFEDFYDIIIDIKSIKDIKEGWTIKMNERGKNNYNVHKDKNEIIKIGIIGNSNKGKSFILSKLSKINLPSGMSFRTEGLSIKYPELEKYKNRTIILLDSAGLEAPVIKDNKDNVISNEKFREKSREKLITELFLQLYYSK